MLVCLDVLFLLRKEGKLWESANVVSLFQNMSQIKLNVRCSLHCQHFQFPCGMFDDREHLDKQNCQLILLWWSFELSGPEPVTARCLLS